jgi:CheY-like chemotaxis protein
MSKMILCVDDDFITCTLHEILLLEAGICKEVYVKKNGEEALQYLEIAAQSGDIAAKMPSLILLDINMPVMDGWQFLTQLQSTSHEVLKTIPVVLCSSSEHPTDQLQAKSFEQVKAFICKPLEEKSLAIIRQLIS